MKLKKILALVLSLAMILSTMSFTVSADTVSKWDGQSYSLEWLKGGDPEKTEGDEYYLNSAEDLAGLKKEAEAVYVHPLLKNYLIDLVHATRQDNQILDGVSPRSSLGLYRAVRAYALVKGRDYVVPEDIKALAVPVLAHRLTTARAFGLQSSNQEIMKRLLSNVPLPTEDWSKRG